MSMIVKKLKGMADFVSLSGASAEQIREAENKLNVKFKMRTPKPREVRAVFFRARFKFC